MLIDDYLPTWDATQVSHIIVDAPVSETFQAVRNWDPTSMRARPVRALVWLREAPETALRRLRGKAPPSQAASGLDVMYEWGWIQLAERPDEELAVGLLGKFWNPVIRPLRLKPDEFAAFDEPGYAKLVISFSVRPYGEGRTLLSYEARTATTSEDAARRFRWYWRTIRPFAGYLMGAALKDIKQDAEAAAA